MTTEREVRKQLVEALEGLEDGWVSQWVRVGTALPAEFMCVVCEHVGDSRSSIDHQPGCPVPPAYAALEAARALDEVKA